MKKRKKNFLVAFSLEFLSWLHLNRQYTLPKYRKGGISIQQSTQSLSWPLSLLKKENAELVFFFFGVKTQTR